MAKEALGTDVNGKVDFSLAAPVSCRDLALAANVISSATTPPNFNRAFISYAVGTNVWMTMDGSNPIVPSTTHATTQELLPSIRQLDIDGGETLKFISDSASFVNIRYDLGA